jgi:hypothetical protein
MAWWKTCKPDIMHERGFLVYYRVGHMVSLETRKAITVGTAWKSLRAPLLHTAAWIGERTQCTAAITNALQQQPKQ